MDPCVHPQPHPDGNSSNGFRKLPEPSRLADRDPGVLSTRTGFCRLGINARSPAAETTLTCPAVCRPESGGRGGPSARGLRKRKGPALVRTLGGKPAPRSLGLLGGSRSALRAWGGPRVPARVPGHRGHPAPPQALPSSGYSSASRFVRTGQTD